MNPKNFFKKNNLTWLENNYYKSKYDHPISPYLSIYYFKNKKNLNQLKQWYASQETKPNSHFEIKKSNLAGWGLFSIESISINQLIGKYTGKIQKANKNWDETTYSWDLPVRNRLFQKLELNAKEEGNHLRFANHSFEPNLVADYLIWEKEWIIVFKTIRKISKNEELTIDYGPNYWNHPDREVWIHPDHYQKIRDNYSQSSLI